MNNDYDSVGSRIRSRKNLIKEPWRVNSCDTIVIRLEGEVMYTIVVRLEGEVKKRPYRVFQSRIHPVGGILVQ